MERGRPVRMRAGRPRSKQADNKFRIRDADDADFMDFRRLYQ